MTISHPSSRRPFSGAVAIAACIIVQACAPASRVAVGVAPAAESRVFDSRARTYISFEDLAAVASDADVVFFGEQHDDPATHRAELALLAAIGARRPNVILSLEMFERDVQPTLDAYLAGQLPESLFLARSRPWPRYTTDYRAMVELARAHGWPVLASNVPRRLASAVSRNGLRLVDTLGVADRGFVARELSCPRDRYFDKFAETMKGHSAGGGPPTASDSAAAAAMTVRFYESQCVKDETMGESIAAAFQRARGNAIVYHVNGSFHSESGLGAAERAMRRLRGKKSVVVTAVPVDNVSSADAPSFSDRGDYIVLTPKPPK